MSPPARQAWCFIPRKPLFLRLEAPRPRPKWPRRRDRRGASSPANPYSFVSRHHALSPNASPGATGVVLHPPQTLIPSSRSTTPSIQMPPPARQAWCSTPQTLVPSSRSTTPLRQTAPPAGGAPTSSSSPQDRLHQLKIHIFRQSARIVVRLDTFLRFEDVRPNGALRQELDAVQFSRLFRKHLDKFVSDDHSLFLRIVYPGKLVRIISNVVCGPLTV